MARSMGLQDRGEILWREEGKGLYNKGSSGGNTVVGSSDLWTQHFFVNLLVYNFVWCVFLFKNTLFTTYCSLTNIELPQPTALLSLFNLAELNRTAEAHSISAFLPKAQTASGT